jgi:RNA polymerase sigma-70 factor (ECF subfamily)
VGLRAERQNLKKLRKGQREAYEAVVSQHYGSIYRFMAYLTGDAASAEELTQETFASAWANIDRFTGRATLGTWLHQIAYRKFIDSRRRLHRDAALMASFKDEKRDTSEASNPLHRLAADEHSRLLYEAMRQLKWSEYVLIVLHYIQGLSFRQVAKVLDQPVGTIKWRTSVALKKLRASLSGRIRP